MAERFQPYHVPQQSRRDKLRVISQTQAGCVENVQESINLVPLYDPSLLSSDLITCANLHHQRLNLGAPPCKQNPDAATVSDGGGVKEKGMNLMGFVGGVNTITPAAASSSSSAATTNHLYMDPQSSVQLSPSTIQDINGSSYIYTPQCLRVLDQSFHGNEVVVYKPEPQSITHEGNCSSAAATCQGLSLSLSSHHTHQSNLPLELNLQRYDSSMFSSNKVSGECLVAGGSYGGDGAGSGGCGRGPGGSTSNELSRNSVPLGPFTGYASILKGSRFLKPAQQLLEELCYVGREIYAETMAPASNLLDLPPLESLNRDGVVDDDPLICSEGGEQTGKKSRLISLLNEVYRRYKHYCQQMQSVVASFESVAGLSHAAPFANLALKAMSKHFRCLRNAITDQLQFIKSHGAPSYERDESQFGNSGRGIPSQRPFHNAGFIDQPVWRPQRGLPERAVTVLRAWLFEHFLHPYPTDTDKIMLAKQTGLTRNQVSNWFINARVRLWKPMVEEIHMLETRQSQNASQREEESASKPNDNLPTSCPVECENTSTSIQRIENMPSSKLAGNSVTGSERPVNYAYDNLSQHVGNGINSAGGGTVGVSLTLGLHQNVGFSETYPVNAARRFGLDAHSEGYVASGFAAQNRQFGRDIMGGQLLHDFVG